MDVHATAALRRLALAALLQDRLAEDKPGAWRLTDPIGTAGGWCRFLESG